MPTLDIIVTTLGWLGAFSGVGAYALVTSGRWTPSGLPFQLTNAGVALCLGAITFSKGAWPSAAANVVWFLIGTRALWKIARSRAGTGRAAEAAPGGRAAEAARTDTVLAGEFAG